MGVVRYMRAVTGLPAMLREKRFRSTTILSMSLPPGLFTFRSTKMFSTAAGRSGYLKRPLSTSSTRLKPGMLVSL